MAKPVLRVGASSGTVKTLQQLLNAHLQRTPPLPVNGVFGNQTLLAVQVFQRSKGLRPDGVVGPRTWAALSHHPAAPGMYRYVPGPQEPLADIAIPFIGATEALGNRMGTDPRMRQIFEADRLNGSDGQTDGYPWCCAFVCLCVQRLIDQNPVYANLTKPTTASVSRFRTVWAPSQNCLLFPPGDSHYQPYRGDVVVFTFSHIGIVDAVGDGMVITIEGNTSEEGSREGTTCRRQNRNLTQIRTFIRLPVPAHYDLERQMCRATIL